MIDLGRMFSFLTKLHEKHDAYMSLQKTLRNYSTLDRTSLQKPSSLQLHSTVDEAQECVLDDSQFDITTSGNHHKQTWCVIRYNSDRYAKASKNWTNVVNCGVSSSFETAELQANQR